MGRSNNSTRLLIDGELLYKTRDVQRLELKWKAAWIYILLTSDSSGFWEPEFDILGLRIGASIDGIKEAEAVKVFKGMYDELPGGTWFIPYRIQQSDKHGLRADRINHLWIFRNWVEQGVDIDKYSFLLKQPKEYFFSELEKLGKHPTPVFSPESKENEVTHPVTHPLGQVVGANGNGNGNGNGVVNAIGNDNVDASLDNKIKGKTKKKAESKKPKRNLLEPRDVSLDNMGNFQPREVSENGKANWVRSNYPHGKIYSDIEQGQINKLVDAWEYEIGFDRIKNKVLDTRTMTPGMVSPLILWLTNQLENSRKLKAL